MQMLPLLLLAALKRVVERLLLAGVLDKLIEYVLFASLQYFASRTTSKVDDEFVLAVKLAYFGPSSQEAPESRIRGDTSELVPKASPEADQAPRAKPEPIDKLLDS